MEVTVRKSGACVIPIKPGPTVCGHLLGPSPASRHPNGCFPETKKSGTHPLFFHGVCQLFSIQVRALDLQ